METPDRIAKLRARAKVSEPRRVIIIGAGIAGLSAAYELQQRGFSVTVLEAEKLHIGGRVRTLRDGKMHAELGAMRIPATHHYTRFYAEHECQLPLRNFVQLNENAFIAARGAVSRVASPLPVLQKFDLQPHEQLHPLKVWQQTVGLLSSQLPESVKQDLQADSPSLPETLALDRQSLFNFLQQPSVGLGGQRLSADGLQLLISALGLESTLHHALTERLREVIRGTWNELLEIKGGTDQLPLVLKNKLDRAPIQNSPVVAIEHRHDQVTAVVRREETLERHTADWLICTVPLGPASAIDYQPVLPPRLAEAMRRVHYASATKVIATCQYRFWEKDEQIYGGGSASDGPLGTTWYPSDNAAKDDDISRQPSMLLASYSWGQRAKRMAENASQKLVAKELGVFHQAVAKKPELIDSVYTWSWDKHRWSAGAYASYMPGEHSHLHQQLRAHRENSRLLFAGEHASLHHSWMQGAFESALHVVETICEQENL